MSAKHTPTPWELLEGATTYGPYIQGIFDATGLDVRVKGFALSGGKEAEANTRFIVLAVNSHDELVAALKEAKTLADTMAGLTACRSDDEWVWGVQEKINAALSRISDVQIKGAA